MKKIIFALTAVLIIFATGCEKKETVSDNKLLTESPLLQYHNFAKNYDQYGIKFRFHRASTGCNSRFSICLVRSFSNDISLKPAYTSIDFSKNTLDIYFLEEISWAEPVFFGKDDSPFIFPEDVLKIMGLSYLEIIPNNYKYNDKITKFIDETGKERACYGQVKVDIVVKK